jgi:hypothetical protein
MTIHHDGHSPESVDRPVRTAAELRRLLPSLVLNVVLPLLAYWLLRTAVGSDVVALGIGAAIPVVATAVGFAWRRRVDPIGIAAIVTFAVLLIILALTGGAPLVLELHDAVLTGPLGLIFLGSVAVRKPLLLVVRRVMARRLATEGATRPSSTLSGADERSALSVLTALIGGILLVHALLILVLALTLPIPTFLAVGRPIGWVVIALGILAVLRYRNRLRSPTANR